jgi:hypothetical protein
MLDLCSSFVSQKDNWLAQDCLELIYLTFYEADTSQNLILQWDACEQEKVNIFLGDDLLAPNISQHLDH